MFPERVIRHAIVACIVIVFCGISLAGPLTFATIDFPGSGFTAATGINDTGQIVGWYDTGSSPHGFLLSNESFSTIDVPGSTVTQAYGINGSGQIVGLYGVADDFNSHGFLLSGGSST